MKYFDNFTKEYEETWYDDMRKFEFWLEGKGHESYMRFLKTCSVRGQMIVPQDSPYWHTGNVFPDFETAYRAYKEETKNAI